jgi:hypothetical protein
MHAHTATQTRMTSDVDIAAVGHIVVVVEHNFERTTMR